MVAGLGAIGAGCGAETATGPTSTERPERASQAASTLGTPGTVATPTAVTIRLLAFVPEELSVPVGTEVRWRQEDRGAHTVTSGTVQDGAASLVEQPDGIFDSGEVSSGADFTFTFSEAGSFPYYCSLHPATMRGVVNVA